MSYLEDHPEEVKNASYYRRQCEKATHEIMGLRTELEQWKKIAADNQAWFDELKAEFASARSSAFSESADICESKHASGVWKYDTRHECAEAIREFAKMQAQ